MAVAANKLQGKDLVSHPQRCKEYWRRYHQLIAKNHELAEARKQLSAHEAEAQIILQINIIMAEQSQHVVCCEQCQSWWRSFEVQK